jgi:DNA-binding CsgD family transcriptional regulator
MARTGRPVAAVVLTDEERETLLRWARGAKSSQVLAQRCGIVLGCAEGKSNQDVAAELGIWPQTVPLHGRADLEGVQPQPHQAETFKLSNDPQFVDNAAPPTIPTRPG